MLERRSYSSSSTTDMAEEAKKLAAYAAVDNHIQVRVSLAVCSVSSPSAR